MATSEKAATKIIDGFRKSNETFDREWGRLETFQKQHGALSFDDQDLVDPIDRAISQLVAAVGEDIGHALIVNAPKGPPGYALEYHCAVFGKGVLAYVVFSNASRDPEILVRTIPRSSITEIQVRSAKDYRNENGCLVYVVKYTNGPTLDIRERNSEGQDVAEPGAWLQELLDDLREDLADAR
jgi:hypothetical protein